jgi:hypothetical protein
MFARARSSDSAQDTAPFEERQRAVVTNTESPRSSRALPSSERVVLSYVGRRSRRNVRITPSPSSPIRKPSTSSSKTWVPAVPAGSAPVPVLGSDSGGEDATCTLAFNVTAPQYACNWIVPGVLPPCSVAVACPPASVVTKAVPTLASVPGWLRMLKEQRTPATTLP